MFALQQPYQLRLRHAQLQRDVKLGKLSKEMYQRQAVEILVALKRLGQWRGWVRMVGSCYVLCHMSWNMLYGR